MNTRVAAGETVEISLTVNRVQVEVSIEPQTLLVELLRETFGLTGTHVGCLAGDCGACTVRIDGLTVKSCLELAVRTDGRAVDTVEALGTVEALHPVQTAFDEEFAFQCGFCLPGMLLTAVEALEHGVDSDQDLRQAINGNLCRCTGYVNVMTVLRRLSRTEVAGR